MTPNCLSSYIQQWTLKAVDTYDVCYFLFVDAVIMGKVVGREASAAGEAWVRLALSVQAVYKRAPRSRLRRGATALHVRATDLACKCPKIKINK